MAQASQQIDDLIEREEWDKARAIIEEELRTSPHDHWLLTQLAETHYEQRRYKKALELLLKSAAIVGDCPLTLWHLAGTLDALEYHAGALRIFAWLLKSNRDADDDPCWESKDWTDALKTDCVYRIGICLRRLGKSEMSLSCFERYIALLSAGAAGSYPLQDAQVQLRELGGKADRVKSELQSAARLLAKTPWGRNGAGEHPPKLDARKIRELQRA